MKRWKKILLALVVFVLVAGVASWYWLFKLGGLEDLAVRKLNSMISAKYPFKVSVGRIGGNVLDGLMLYDVSVRFADSLGGRELFMARRMSALYSWRNLIDSKLIFNQLRLDTASITLVQDSAGRFGLPFRPGRQATDVAAPLPEFSVDRLQLIDCSFTVIKPTDTLRLFDVNFNASALSEDQTVAMNITHANVNSNRPQYYFPSISGKLTYADGRVLLQDVNVIRRDSRIKLSGYADLREKSGQLAVNADNLDLAELEPYLHAKLTGKIDAYGDLNFDSTIIHGTLALGGRFFTVDVHNLYAAFHYHLPEQQLVLDTAYGVIMGRCGLDATGLINFKPRPQTYRLNLAVEHFNLEELAPGSLSTDLNARVAMQGSSFKSDQLLMDVTGDIWDSYFADYPVQQAHGRMEITSTHITFPDTFVVSYFDNEFDLTGTVNYRTDLDLNVKAHLRNLDQYRGKLFLKEIGGRGYAEVTMSGQTKDPDLSGFFVSDSVWLYDLYSDSVEAGIQIEHMFGAQTGTIYATALNGTLYGQPYDTIFTVMGVGQGAVTVDTAFARFKAATLTAKGEVLYRTNPQQVYIDSVTIAYLDQKLYNQGEIQVLVDSAGFDIRKGAIASNGAVALAMGRYNYDRTLNLAFSVNDVPIKAWASLFRKDFPVDGRASFQGKLGGALRNPTFSVDGKVDSLMWRDLVLGNLTTIASYHDRTLFLDSAVLLSSPGVYRATGKFNLDLDFTSDSVQFSDRPFDVAISATDRRFDLVTLFLPSVEYLAGDMAAEVRLFGTPKDPHLEGAVLLTGARMKYFDLVDTLFADSANFLMRDNQVVVEQISAYTKDNRVPGGKSYANLKGTLTFTTLNDIRWDIAVDIPRPFRVRYSLDDIEVRVEGDMSIEGNSPPQVTGDLTISYARYRANFATPEEGSPLMTMLTGDQTWDLNLNIDMPSNFWIDNEDIDAEFSGQLNVIREQGNYRFIGEMDILRGKTSLFDRTWQIESGSKATYDDIAKPNPNLDITACTVIRSAGSTSSEPRQDVDLCIHVTDRLETPQLAVASGSGFSREDLIPLLVADRATADSAGSGMPVGGMEQRLTGLLSTQVSQIGSRQLSRIGVETFEIDPLYSGKFDPLKSRVTLGFYTLNTYFYLQQSISGTSGYGFEYRLNKSFMLAGQRDENNLYHLNLRLSWEFR